MSSLRFVLSLSTVALICAASTGCGSRQSSPELGPERSSSGSRIVTSEMIARWNVIDAFDVVERTGGYRLAGNDAGDVAVRQSRGRSSILNRNADTPVLTIDGAITSDFSMLRRIRAAEIERIEFLSPTDATQKFGMASSGAGAIIVITRARDDL